MNEPTLRILIVDDHAIVREGLVRILEGTGRGWQVAEATSGSQALEWLRRNDAALAIVDLSMPGMSGLDLIARLRKEFPRLRVLVLSMHAEEQYALRAFQSGAHGYVTKDRARPSWSMRWPRWRPAAPTSRPAWPSAWCSS